MRIINAEIKFFLIKCYFSDVNRSEMNMFNCETALYKKLFCYPTTYVRENYNVVFYTLL